MYTDFYDNYMEFDRFLARLRLLSQLKSSGNTDADIVVVKVWILDAQEETSTLDSDFVSLICKRFPTHKVSSANNMVYIRNSVYAGDQENDLTGHELTDRLDIILDKAATGIAPGERICYAVSRYEEDIEEFINDLHFTAPFPEKTFPYRPAEEGEQTAGNGEEPEVGAPAPVTAMPETAPAELTDLSVDTHETAEEVTEEEYTGIEDTEEGEMREETEEEESSHDSLPILRGIVIALAVVVVGVLLFFLWYTPEEEQPYMPMVQAEEMYQADSVLEDMPTDMDTTETLDETETSAESEISDETAEQQALVTEEPAEPVIEETRRGMYYVVEGAFSLKENAEWQLRKNAESRPGYDYSVYKHGSMYIVSPYCSADPAQCEAFIRNENLSNQAWYTEGKRKEDGL